MVETLLANELKSRGIDTMDAAVKELVTGGVIAEKAVLRWMVHGEFWKLYTKGGRTARNVEEELASKYDLDLRVVRRYRNLTGPFFKKHGGGKRRNEKRH